jgi:hypothetical protein
VSDLVLTTFDWVPDLPRVRRARNGPPGVRQGARGPARAFLGRRWDVRMIRKEIA